jgi:hypothetical protein
MSWFTLKQYKTFEFNFETLQMKQVQGDQVGTIWKLRRHENGKWDELNTTFSSARWVPLFLYRALEKEYRRVFNLAEPKRKAILGYSNTVTPFCTESEDKGWQAKFKKHMDKAAKEFNQLHSL